MTQQLSVDDIKNVLLDMLSTTRAVNSDHMAALGDADWKKLSDMAAQHRLGPILDRQCQIRGTDWVVPGHVRKRWRDSFRQSALRSLASQRALHVVNAIHLNAAIPFAALKGAWLSLHAYPHPALRPMRDIDILVGIEDAVQSFTLMQAAGFDRSPDDVQPLSYYLTETRDMPVLYCQHTGIKFEIHFRITHEAPDDPVGTLADTKYLLSRRIGFSVGSDELPYLCATDALLHLIVHAAYDHRFNNGPLVLNDIAAMLEHSEVDWQKFWSMAKAGNWTRGCQLLLALTKHYHAQPAIIEHAGVSLSIPPNILAESALLMLQDFKERAVIAFRSEIQVTPPWRKFAPLWKRAFPPRFILATYAGLPTHSNLAWIGYPRWLATRSKQMILHRLDSASRADVNRDAKVGQWLRAKDL